MKEKTFTLVEIITKITEGVEEFCNEVNDKSQNFTMFKMSLIAAIASEFIKEE